LFDPDIYTDGRISVQGIDAVMFPPETAEEKAEKENQVFRRVAKTGQPGKVTVKKQRRGQFSFLFSFNYFSLLWFTSMGDNNILGLNF